MSKDPSANGRASASPWCELDVGPDAAGNGQHRLVEVDADDGAVGATQVGGGAGDDPGAAGHVEDAAGLRRRRRRRRGSAPTGRRTPARTPTRRTRLLRSGIWKDSDGSVEWSCTASSRPCGVREHRAAAPYRRLVPGRTSVSVERWATASPSAAGSVGGRLGPVAQAELGQDVADVVGRRLAADVRRSAISGLDSPAPSEPQDLLLPVGEHSRSLRSGTRDDAERAEEGGDPIGIERRRRASSKAVKRVTGMVDGVVELGRRRAREASSKRVRASSNGSSMADHAAERGLQVGWRPRRVAVARRDATASAPSANAVKCSLPSPMSAVGQSAGRRPRCRRLRWRRRVRVDEQVRARRRDATGDLRDDGAVARGGGPRAGASPRASSNAAVESASSASARLPHQGWANSSSASSRRP